MLELEGALMGKWRDVDSKLSCSDGFGSYR